MTLDEAIIHCEEVAEEHRQLAEWLKEYKETKRKITELQNNLDIIEDRESFICYIMNL